MKRQNEANNFIYYNNDNTNRTPQPQNRRKKSSSSLGLLEKTFLVIAIIHTLLFVLSICITTPSIETTRDKSHFHSFSRIIGSHYRTNNNHNNNDHYQEDIVMKKKMNKDKKKNKNKKTRIKDERQSNIHKQQQKNQQNQQNYKIDTDTSYLTMYGEHRAKSSFALLPGWIQDYILWNQQQPSISNTNNHNYNKNNSTKYLVLICLPKDDTCGGLSDRFRGLLFYLFLSKISNRKLCIYWTRPFPLHTFLLPTKSGIDWRCPEQELSKRINPKFSSGSQHHIRVNYFMDCEETTKHPAQPFLPCLQREIHNLLSSNDTFAITKLFGNSVTAINQLNLVAQAYSYTGYMPIINQWQYPDMMQDIFRTLFQPVPILAKRVNETMNHLGLVENEYISVHVRTRYPVRFYGATRNDNILIDKQGVLPFEGRVKDYLVNIMDNAIHCGHLLGPNLPIYFASDHNEATRYAITTNFTFLQSHVEKEDSRNIDHNNIIVQKNNSKIIRPVGVHHDKMPVHVGVTEFQEYNHSDFESVFLELLIMGGSRCVSHGIGSFGSFAAGLSGNKCRAVHRSHSGRSHKCPNDRGVPKKMKIVDESYKPFGEELFGPWDHKLISDIEVVHEI